MTDPRPHHVDVVIPTVARASLASLLAALAPQVPGAVGRVVVVDDRRAPDPAELRARGVAVGLDVEVEVGPGAGPAAARNVGWRATSAPWVAFLDDDVVPPAGWAAALLDDLAACGPQVAATQGRVRVPLPAGRRPTDWERNVAGLERARWATADMAYRRRALLRLGGFDERFPRAYREDADLGLRAVAAGYDVVQGSRSVDHPVRPAPWHVSVGKQAGNADDALMTRLHGPTWRVRAGAPPGAFTRHAATTAALVGAAVLACRRRRAPATVAAVSWTLSTLDFAWRRTAPGPRTPAEVAAMLVTSVAIPPVAVWHRVAGVVRARREQPRPVPPAAVLFDRDGTLVVDVPYNGDPGRVRAMPGARQALDRVRAAGIPVGLVSNQSGVARGLLTMDQVAAVNERVSELLGPFDAVLVCPHGHDDGCACRKPAPGMVLEAASQLGVAPERCAVVGDIGSDVGAALAAGARPVLVPTDVTLPAEVAAAPEVAPDIGAAVERLLGSAGPAVVVA
jgi:histidinol-phosphate phosphatase family protein